MTSSQGVICSARGCEHDAVYHIVWNNPKIHTPDRRKQWQACGDHEETLRQFLSSRGFYIETTPLS